MGEALGEGDTQEEGEEEPVGALLVALTVLSGLLVKLEEALAPSTEEGERVWVGEMEVDGEGVVESVEDLILDPDPPPNKKGEALGVGLSLGRTSVSVGVEEGGMERLEVGE